MMMSTAEKDVKMCEETSIISDGGNTNHTEADCIREAIAVETEQNIEEELAFLSIPAYVRYGNTMMEFEQISSEEEKEEMCAINENKGKPQHTSVAASKKEVITTVEFEQISSEEEKEEMCDINENKGEPQHTSVAASKKEVITTVEFEQISSEEEKEEMCAINENKEPQHTSVAASKKEVSTTVEFEQISSEEEKEEMCAINENKGEPQHTSVAASKKEVSTTDEAEEKETCTVDETAEERIEAEELSRKGQENVTPSKNNMSTVEKSTETQNLIAPSFKKEGSTTDEVVNEKTEAQNLSAALSKNEMSTPDEAVEDTTEAQNLSFGPFRKEVSIIDEVLEERTKVQNLSIALSKNEVCITDESVEGRTETQNLIAELSEKEANTTDALEERAKLQSLSTPSSKKEVSTTDESVEKSIETINLTGVLSEKEVSTANEAADKITEAPNLSAGPSRKEMSSIEEAIEKSVGAQDLSTAPYENISTADEAIDKMTETKNLSSEPSKKDVKDAKEERPGAQNLSAELPKKEVGTEDEAVEGSTETQNVSAGLSKKEVNTVKEVVEERSEAQNLSATPSKEVSTIDEAVEGRTEAQNLSAEPSKKEGSPSDYTLQERLEDQNLRAASSKMEVSGTKKAVYKSPEAQNLSAGSSCKEVNSIEESAKAQSLNTASSRREVCSTEETIESQNLSGEEMSSTEEALEESANSQDLSATLSNKKVSTIDEAMEKRPGVQNLSVGAYEKEVSTTEYAIEEKTGAQNLSAGPSKKEVSTTEDAIERSGAQNLSAGPSKKVENISEEAVGKKRECQNLKAAPFNKEVSIKGKVAEIKSKARNLSAAMPKKEKSSIEEVVKKMIKCRLGVASTKRKMSPRKVMEERNEADGASASSYNQEMSTAVEENDPGVCGPSKKVCTAVRTIEKNKEECKASTSASSSSRCDSDISVLRSIPRNSTPIRRRLINSRRILMNRRARLAEGFHVVFNGKTIAPKHPKVSVPRVHVTAEAFPSLTSELYSVLPETFKDAVSMSMMEYYLMILYYHRLAGLRMTEHRPLPEDEVLCSNLELGPLFVPDMMEQWITMRGHDINTRGEAIRLVLPPIPSDTGDFGQLSATTHWRYMSDLAPRIFRDRIAADLEHTLCSGPVEWNLPEDLRPQERNCGLPTRNLIGYHVAQRLTASQIDELHLCSIGIWNDKAVFPVDIDAECYHLNIHLVQTISQHFAALGSKFRIVRHARYDSQSSSAGLIIYGERMVSEAEEYLFDRNASHYEQNAKVRAYAPIALDKELAKGAVVFLPRVYRRDGKGPINRSWCAYDFGFYFMVPDEWTATRNNAYKQGSWQAWHTPHLTTASVMRANLLKAVVKRLVFSKKQSS